MNERKIELKKRLEATQQAPYPCHSRIHPLKTYVFPSVECYVKRDDELGFGASGSKIRKYRTLIPFLIASNIEEVVLIGSAYSNHALSFAQLLIENQIKPTLFLRGDPHRPLQGNALLTNLLVPRSSIRWFAKDEWKTVDHQAQVYAAACPHLTFVLAEGGFAEAAFPGALTLPLDILLNEEQAGMEFDHICIDAGTGFIASALILGLEWMGHRGTVHVLLLAEDIPAFHERLDQCREMFSRFVQQEIAFPQNFELHLPKLTGGFGRMTSNVFEEIAFLAKGEGFLTDPVYTGKLFLEIRSMLNQGNVRGKVLIHHSGGALSLLGFEKQLNFL